MSEKSFAVASISVAFVWGTFFYPPAPQVADATAAGVTLEQPAQRARSSDMSREAVKLGLTPASLDQASLSPSAPDIHKASLQDCTMGAAPTDDCAPLPKLAGH